MKKTIFWKATTSELTKLLNLPEVRPHFGYKEGCVLDASGLYRTPGNVGFSSDVGGLFFESEGDGVFVIHAMFKPLQNGKAVKAAAKAMLTEMFTSRGARVIRGNPPRDNRAVRHLCFSLGFRRLDMDDFVDDNGRVCSTYELRKEGVLC